MDLVAPAVRCIRPAPLAAIPCDDRRNPKPRTAQANPAPTSAWTQSPSDLCAGILAAGKKLGLPIQRRPHQRHVFGFLPLVMARCATSRRPRRPTPPNSASLPPRHAERGVYLAPQRLRSGLHVPGPQRTPTSTAHPHRLQGLLRRDRLRVCGLQGPQKARVWRALQRTLSGPSAKRRFSLGQLQPSIRPPSCAQILCQTLRRFKTRNLRGFSNASSRSRARRSRRSGPGPPVLQPTLGRAPALQPLNSVN